MKPKTLVVIDSPPVIGDIVVSHDGWLYEVTSITKVTTIHPGKNNVPHYFGEVQNAEDVKVTNNSIFVY